MSIVSAIRISRVPGSAFLALGLFWGSFAAQVPVLKAGLGASDGLFGTLLLGSAFGLVTAMLIAPRVDAALGARGMQAAALLIALAMLLPGIVTVQWGFFLVMMVLGFAAGLLDVLMNTRVSDLEAATGKPLMNANHALFSVGYAVGAVLAGLGREAGLHSFTIFAGVALIMGAVLLGLRMQPAAEDGEDPSGTRSPFWPVILCGLVVLVAFGAEATVEAWSALHIERTLQGGAAEGAMGPATLGLTMAFGRFAGQAVSERFRATTVVIVAGCVSASGAVIAALAATPVVAYLGFGILGLGVSVIGPLGLGMVGRLVTPRQRARAISRVAIVGFSAFFFAPVLMGWSSELWGLRVSYAGVAGVLLLSVPLGLAVKALQARRA
ncbi:MFS transporter [Salibaculum griseiflavum]|uniref:MFS transporter n=1 Tax=Salibaculum griseiflavum TaxID=1914409 RepID=A0A2V1P838_9RHOB|nr:MFS transporter [Salibaculum griseiflavum]PWG17960.1 MFS transporter [Salibaculum griseiflavum]